jgi:hypothetical protein
MGYLTAGKFEGFIPNDATLRYLRIHVRKPVMICTSLISQHLILKQSPIIFYYGSHDRAFFFTHNIYIFETFSQISDDEVMLRQPYNEV